jgi:septal ring factor EnvC (AmiA/AmiB activator)
MSSSLTTSLVGVAFTLAAILVQLGRVLQRADQNEASLKELKERREKELKPQADLIAAVHQRTHDLSSAIQGVSAHHTLLESRIAHAEAAGAELRHRQSGSASELRAVLAEVLDRLARVETAMAHSSPPSLPAEAVALSPSRTSPARRGAPHTLAGTPPRR